jgi:hydroxyacylglutathione hydrolase
MANHFVVINLHLPMRMGRVNSYLLIGATSVVLIDTGSANARDQLVMELKKAGCVPGSLGLVLLTHGDFDHTGSAAYICSAFGARIAIHKDDIGMVEHGDMFYNRKPPNIFIRSLIPIFIGFGRSARFTPDILIDDGHDLAKFGYEARVISPGHLIDLEHAVAFVLSCCHRYRLPEPTRWAHMVAASNRQNDWTGWSSVI